MYAIFCGRMVIHRRPYDPVNTTDEPRLYQVQGYSELDTRVMEVDAAAASLNSGALAITRPLLSAWLLHVFTQPQSHTWHS